MGTASVLSMMLFQGGDAVSSDQFHWLLIFVGVIAFCSFVQFLVMVGAAIGALKAYKDVSGEIGMMKQKALPLMASVQGAVEDARPVVNKITAKVQEIVDDATPKVKVITTKVQEIVEDATPKVKTVTANVAEISDVARNKVHEFEGTLDRANQTFREANEKTRAQVDKVDGMVSSALKATSDVGNTIHRGIRAPVVEVAGVVNGLKAALDVLIGRTKAAGTRYPGGDAGNRGRRSYGRGPAPVPSSEPVPSPNPSSAVAPSPGAAAVVDRVRGEQVKTTY